MIFNRTQEIEFKEGEARYFTKKDEAHVEYSNVLAKSDIYSTTRDLLFMSDIYDKS